jgi:hypothetical protein
MPDEKDIGKVRSKESPLRAALTRLPYGERVKIQAAIQRAVEEHDLPKFKTALLRLAIDEFSDAYEQLLKLWDEYLRT